MVVQADELTVPTKVAEEPESVAAAELAGLAGLARAAQ